MAIRRVDPNSGALVYDLTPEEQETKRLKAELEELKKEKEANNKQLSKIMSILESAGLVTKSSNLKLTD